LLRALLAPYNLNTQSVRTRFWTANHMIRDDLSWNKESTSCSFAELTAYFNWHLRTDNGGSVNNEIVYDLASGGGTFGNSGVAPGRYTGCTRDQRCGAVP